VKIDPSIDGSTEPINHARSITQNAERGIHHSLVEAIDVHDVLRVAREAELIKLPAATSLSRQRLVGQ
jgi:hypothetical protein